MRILVVSQYFWPENFRINDLVAELVSRGHQVTVLTGKPNYPEGVVFPEFAKSPDAFMRYEGAQIVRVPMLPRGAGSIRLILNYLSFAVSAVAIGSWKLRGKDFDVIFACQLSPVTVGLPAAFMRSIKRAPLVFWVLDLWPDTLQAIGVLRSPFLLKMAGCLVSFIYKQCDFILAQSRSFIPLIQKFSSAHTPVLYFPSWAEAVFGVSDDAPAKEVSEKLGSLTIVFTGNIGEAQDFPVILDAAEKLKNHSHIRWLIVGDGRMANWVKQQIQERQLGGCVFLLGRYPLERMPSFFKHADALLVSLQDKPIFSMTIPGKLQSYLATGTPCIAMLNGEGADVIRSANAGIVCVAGDAVGLVQAVLTLDGMSIEDRQAMGKNALKVSEQEFNRNALISQLEVWLSSVELAGTPARHAKRCGDLIKRVFDLTLAIIVSVVLLTPILMVAIAVRLTSNGPILYWSERVGCSNQIFKMPKFRSMRVGTPAVATHLLQDPSTHLTSIGAFIRKSSLDELPQLWCVFTGEMSFVGPRPALFNQLDLIELRTQLHVDELLPGITGWAQVNGRDELSTLQKVKLDQEYLYKKSLFFDARILFLTFLKVLNRDGISH